MLNRQQRRMAESYHRKNVKQAIASNEWTAFENRTEEARPKYPGKNLIGFYGNNIYSVQVFKLDEQVVAGIRRHDQSTNVSWEIKQRIKNELFGPEVSAVEVFPKASDLVDQANMYWIWITDCAEFNLKNLKL